MAKKHDYKSEGELCEVFADHAKKLGWRVFPETSDFDMLLVATDEVRTINAVAGDQIGVHAKLRDNVDVLAQALPASWDDTGPHYHAVLVPKASESLIYVARRLSILVFQGTKLSWVGSKRQTVRGIDRCLYYLSVSDKQYYTEPAWHPDIELWTPPGVRSPKRITPWKVKSVRLCLLAEERGFLLSEDFRSVGIGMQRWVKSEWIEATTERVGRAKKYVLNLARTPPHLLYPEIAERLRADNAAKTTPGNVKSL